MRHFTASLTSFAVGATQAIGSSSARMEAIHALESRLDRMTIENQDWKRCLDPYDRPGTFFFLDPPYTDCQAGMYSSWSTDDVTAMRDRLTRLEGEWRRLPGVCGRWRTTGMRLYRGSRAGVIERGFTRRREEQILPLKIEVISLDSTSVKVHPDGTGARKKTGRRPSASRAEAGIPKARTVASTRFWPIPRTRCRPRIGRSSIRNRRPTSASSNCLMGWCPPATLGDRNFALCAAHFALSLPANVLLDSDGAPTGVQTNSTTLAAALHITLYPVATSRDPEAAVQANFELINAAW